MQPTWNILSATQKCHYKVWQITRNAPDSQEDLSLNYEGLHLPVDKITQSEKVLAAAWCFLQMQSTRNKPDKIKLIAASGSVFIIPNKYLKEVHKLLAELKDVIEKNAPPTIYRNSHCPQCQFKDECFKKLKERDCISLLSGMPQKTLEKYHKKGITTITQLSHTFRLKRRLPKTVGNYLYELKALAIREQKTFVIKSPDLRATATSIYIDFEGLPEDNAEYLLGVIIKKENTQQEVFSFWANTKADEENVFIQLIELLNEYPDVPIYHYGSYELTAIKKAAKTWKGIIENSMPALEKRMTNLLSYLRTHIYPPTYTNGLKEIGNFLGFKWSDEKADGLLSMVWRHNWLNTHDDDWKQKLIQYNTDDCSALSKVHDWLYELTINAAGQENVQEVSKLNRYSPYRLQRNDFAEDYQYINKAAYFDYQRSKIYWRNNKTYSTSKASKIHFGKGRPVWQPKKVNEIIQLPLLKNCPHCHSDKLYHLSRERTYLQTDLKFTRTGIKQWVIEYHAGCGKCARCLKKYNDVVLRRLQVGDNLVSWSVNLYVNYHVSFSMISRMLLEQFGIWTNPTYFNDRIYYWWDRFKPDVNYCWKIIFNSPVIHIDETTVRLSKGQERGYVWVFATNHTVFYHLTITREAAYLHDWLKDYKGVIVTDFFAGYESLPVKQQKCLVHLIRDLNDDLFKNPFDEEYKTLVAAFGVLLKKIILSIDKHGLKTRYLSKHISEVGAFYKKYVETDYKSELANKCIKRFKKQWKEMWTFLSYDAVPWNNNNAEVAIKAFAQHRRGVNGQVSESGLRPYLSMLTIAQSCRYRDISFLDYLRGKTGIWKNIDPNQLPGILPFNQARLFIQKLKFKSIAGLKVWEDSGKRPAFIPDNPAYVYRDEGWKGWKDWIGI